MTKKSPDSHPGRSDRRGLPGLSPNARCRKSRHVNAESGSVLIVTESGGRSARTGVYEVRYLCFIPYPDTLLPLRRNGN